MDAEVSIWQQILNLGLIGLGIDTNIMIQFHSKID